ncbi:MAG: PKD domain-containing protein [Bacteroidales bacterium]|nr:PKD domain-containing protein [Bacteroidales bacterium]
MLTTQFTDNTTISSGSVVSWAWDFGDGFTSNLQNPTHVYSVGGAFSVTLTVVSDSACQNSLTQQVNITAPPVSVAGPDAMICANGTFTLSGSLAGNYSTIQWNSSGSGSFTNSGILHPVYTPGASDITAGSVILSLTAYGNTPCGDAADDMLLTINSLPIANAGPDDNTCQGMNYTISGASALNTTAAGVLWTENGAGSLINANTLTPTYVPAFGETGTVTFTLTVSGALTCAAETSTDTRLLTFTPLPDIIAGNDATICAANTYTLNGTQQFCSSYTWSSSGDGTFSNPNSLNAVYTPGVIDIATGTATLTLTGLGMGTCSGMSDNDAILLTIDPMPVSNAGPDDAFCVLNPVNVTGAFAANFSSYQWSGGDGIFNNNTLLSPTYMPGTVDFNNGSVTLTLAVQGRLTCSGQTVSDSRVFAVSPYPVVNAGPDDYICSNVTQFQLNGVGNNYNAANIQWSISGGDGFLSNPNIFNPVYFAGPIDLSTTDRNITFTLTLEGVGVCSGTFVNDQIILKIDPTPISNAGPDDEICGQRPYQLNANAQFQNTISWITTGDGTFSNPNTLNPTYTPGPNDVGNVVVLSLDLAGCQSLTGDDFMWLTVHPDPSATISGTISICEAEITPITIDFTGTPPWSVTYTNGTTPVIVNNIMSSPYTFNVSPPVTTSYWISASNDLYCNTPNDSIHGLAAITVFPLPDPFTVTVTNGGFYCEGTPGVTIGLSGSQVGMTYELLLNGLPEGSLLPGTGKPLSFGIKSTPGQYAIRGTNPVGNCDLMMQDTVNVIMNPTPVTDFTTLPVCNTDTTFFTVSGAFINKISNWHWDFGDGTFATFNAPVNPWHIYPTYGIFQVTLNVEDTNNCTYSISHPVEVRPHPTAFFSYNTPNCLGDATQFTELSINPAGQGYINQWIWNFGDGSPNDTINFPTTANPVHSYAGAGTYLVTLSIVNSRGCTDIYSTTITVTRRPLADFDFWSNCQDELAIFNDASNTNGGGAVTSWSWDFGDPASGSLNTSTLEDPTHLYTTAGLYDVTLIVQNFNGCSDTILRQVNVKGAPLADFNSTTGCLGHPTHFWADSTLINLNATATYHWDFGDGSTSNTRNTQYTYIAAGTYTVILTITDTAGCEGSRSHTLTVTPPPTALFSSATDNCQGQTISFNNQSTTESGYLTSWSWDFGDGSPVQTILFPSIPDVSHIYAVTGTFNVTLTVTNSEGCTHSYSRLVNVFGSPTADFMSSGHCKDSPVHFTDLTTTSGSQSLTSWQWNFGDPGSGVFNTSSDQNPIHAMPQRAAIQSP